MLATKWDQPEFPEWREEFVDKILTDSPWARPITVPFLFSSSARAPLTASRFAQIGEPLGLPKGWPGDRQPQPAETTRVDERAAPPARTEIYLTARWASAEPVRRAMALHRFGRRGLASPKAVALLEGNAKEYSLELAGFPAGMIPQGTKRFEAQLLASAVITWKGGNAIRAIAAEVPEHGNHLMATLSFPRSEQLSVADGSIEIFAQAGTMEVRQKFKLREMIYRGRLEL